MRISIDVSTVPPAVTLMDAHDFTSLNVVIAQAEHAYIAPGTLRQLAGDAAQKPGWGEQLETMLDFARKHGWTGDDGAVRAHVEWTP